MPKFKIARNSTQVKGQLISNFFFGVVYFLQKKNENKSICGIIVVKSNLFVRFLEEIDDPKKLFEINWPLVETQNQLIVVCTYFRFPPQKTHLLTYNYKKNAINSG